MDSAKEAFHHLRPGCVTTPSVLVARIPITEMDFAVSCFPTTSSYKRMKNTLNPNDCMVGLVIGGDGETVVSETANVACVRAWGP